MQSQQPHPVEPNVASSGACVSTKGSCDPDTDILDKRGLYIDDSLPRLIVLGRVYEGSSIVHHMPLTNDMVKVGVEEVRDADAHVPIPTKEALNTFIAWAKHLVKLFSEHDKQVSKGPKKLVDRAEPDDYPIYLMTLMIPQLFLKPMQPIQKSRQSQFEYEDYIKKWMQNSKRNVYLGVFLNSALKKFNDKHESKSKANAKWIPFKCNKQREKIECDYYVMH
ncbi:hypothetical protein GmHk_06G016610 [Glycine max]|nr:hypothetical protein GmHk_06G016610 [Glycine max]